jgi:hypothetical protein
LEVHIPLAHARPDPQESPFGLNVSVGHEDELPVHVSATSHCAFFAARHTVVLGANPHEEVQHVLDVGSHTAPDANLHWAVQQDVPVTVPLVEPGSQSSPDSTIPLPHWSSEMSFGDFEDAGREAKQVLFVKPPPPESEPVIREPGPLS